jgi:hypothetical protein
LGILLHEFCGVSKPGIAAIAAVVEKPPEKFRGIYFSPSNSFGCLGKNINLPLYCKPCAGP